MQKNILIVEDDPDIAELVRLNLTDAGYQTTHAADGPSGLNAALADAFDLVILDLMLPGIDGLEVCRRLRDKRPDLPILILTSRSEEVDKVLGLELGADDYLTKPFGVRELIARVRAILRRSARPEPGAAAVETLVTCGELSIDTEKRKVLLADRAIELTAKEFDLLHLFATHPGRVYSREQILNQIWGYQYRGYEHTVNTHINRLRAKIEPDPSKPRYITTVWGVGYRFAETPED